MDTATWVQILDETVYISLGAKSLDKDIHRTILLTAMNTLVRQPVKEKEISVFKFVQFRFKMTLCLTLFAVDRVWFGLVLWHVNLCRLFNAKSILCKLSVLFQTIQFSMSTQFVKNISISNNSVYSSSYI